jgi:CrcB protein
MEFARVAYFATQTARWLITPRRKEFAMGRFLLIGVGGVVGAVLRYVIGTQTQLWFKSSSFPYGTLLVNLTGCFAIGFIFFFLSSKGELGSWGLFLITGMLGAYTTFSTLSLDLFGLISAGELGKAAANFAFSNGLGLLLVWAGKLAADLASK